jgi:hypothetical protein
MNKNELLARCKKLDDALEESLGEDIDNDLYAEVKESRGCLQILEKWINFDPGAVQVGVISGVLDEIEDFITNQLPKTEEEDA